MMANIDRNFNFYLSLNLSEYAGKWIAILDNRIIATGASLKEVFEKAKNDYPNKRPLFDHVPVAGHHFLK